MKIINVVGARPNFMKIAPLMEEMRNSPQISPLLVHTGKPTLLLKWWRLIPLYFNFAKGSGGPAEGF